MLTATMCQNDPSPHEIRRRCQEVQKAWSLDERLNRAGIKFGQPIRFVSPESRLLTKVASHRERAA